MILGKFLGWDDHGERYSSWKS